MKKFFAEFKKFAFKGNIVDLAVAVVIGAAFNAIVNSLVNDIIMPLVGVGKISFENLFIALDGNTYETVAAAKEAGAAVLNAGSFIQAFVNFIIIAMTLFIIIHAFNKLSNLKKEEAPAPAPAPVKEPRLCPFCRLEIADDATRCPHCTSNLE